MQRTASLDEDRLDTAARRFADDPGLDLLVVLDRHGRALCLLRRRARAQDPSGEVQVVPVSLRVAADADLAEVASRAMTRPAEHRFDPIVCNDAYGGYLGVVLPEHVVLRLAEFKNAGRSADT